LAEHGLVRMQPASLAIDCDRVWESLHFNEQGASLEPGREVPGIGLYRGFIVP
jgi:hypothetical protein